MRYCPNCGMTLPDDATYCRACGRKLPFARKNRKIVKRIKAFKKR